MPYNSQLRPPGQSAKVITTLAGITTTDPAEVVQTAKAMFMQQG